MIFNKNELIALDLLQDFVHARQLFSACLELVTEFSPKLRQVMLNEMLLLDVRAHEAEGGLERPPSDLVSRVRGYLEMRIHGKSFFFFWTLFSSSSSYVPHRVIHSVMVCDFEFHNFFQIFHLGRSLGKSVWPLC